VEVKANDAVSYNRLHCGGIRQPAAGAEGIWNAEVPRIRTISAQRRGRGLSGDVVLLACVPFRELFDAAAAEKGIGEQIVARPLCGLIYPHHNPAYFASRFLPTATPRILTLKKRFLIFFAAGYIV
jgi:hypothetical protein